MRTKLRSVKIQGPIWYF